MIKLIVSDIDGTLIKNSFNGNPYHVTKNNKDAINNLKKHDIVFALATGRNHASAKNVLDNIHLSTYVISQNGTYLIGQRNKQFSSNAFEPDQTLKIMKLLTDNKIDYLLTGPNTIGFDVFSDNKITPANIDVNGGDKYLISQKILDEFNTHAHRVGTITAIPPVSMDFEHVEQLIRAEIDNSKFEVVQSSNYTIDITLKNITKASAILQLCEELMITPDQVAVIGDNFNDLPMFKVFKNSYVISDADPRLKKHAKYEVSEVHEAINHILGANYGN